ncbi:GNAT family N-acetyltransferase [Gloeobacter kilaueensis]|uniref:MarR family transcriptional regulator n=1 Tax=Gloeobacter kilaueensis (strain ATCC BAA-2537 / CCAP 1431/1 / ULC 316 / JS1) TaxID=1183438 RepID=U5QP67_GLOK1|nr:GNAT family N-acetyltransferase [Gloeobacter kilaueensis]AGY59359.1 MarR family transcriptional regulator [Gloeobacter kilaueensis JS1]
MEKVQLRGYSPGTIGKVTELHGSYYGRQWNLGLRFEAQVAGDLSQFLLELDEKRDRFFAATVAGEVVGSLAVDGRSREEGARLRWFVLAPTHQGLGIGQILLQAALDFCLEASFERVYLWTFAGLDAAHHLYRKFGFTLSRECTGDEWGRPLTYQMFERAL